MAEPGWTPVAEPSSPGSGTGAWTPVAEPALAASHAQATPSPAAAPPPSPRALQPPPSAPMYGSAGQFAATAPPVSEQGKRNIEMAGGAVGAMALPEAALPFIGSGGAASIIGAGAGGATANLIGSHSPSEAATAGGTQAAYEAGGQAIAWPFKALGRRILGSQIADTVRTKLAAGLDSAQKVFSGAKEGAATRVNAAKAGRATATAEASQTARQGVVGAKQTAADATTAAEQRGTAQLGEQQQAFQSVVQPPPSRSQIERKVQGVIQGPAKSSLDKLGQAVQEHAQSGPPVDFRPVKAAVAKMTAATQPAVDPASKLVMPDGSPMPADLKQKVMAAAPDIVAGLPDESHPLHGALKQVAEAPDTVPFEDAHKYKRLLDDAVNWESPAKKQVQQITKGVRQSVRSSMAAVGHQPYEEATAAYQQAAPLFKPSTVQQLQKTATTNPQALTHLVKGTDSTKIQMLKELLLTHAGQGGGEGGARAGQDAWNAVRGAWTHDHLIQGGVDKFSDRLGKLDPEFVHQMYGDAEGGAVLDRLKTIAQTFDQVKQTSQQEVERATTTGAQGVEAARQAGATGVTQARATGTQAVAQAGAEGRSDIASARNLVNTTKAKAVEFGKSSLVTPPPPTKESMAVDLAHIALHKGSLYTWPAVKRLMNGPKGSELVYWASMSPARTQMLVRAVTSPIPGQAVADLIRGLNAPAAEEPPMAVSHAQPAATPPPSR